MNIELYKWLVPLFILVFIIRLIVQYVNGKRSLQNSILWIFMGLFVAGLAIIPDQISFPIAEKLGFKSNINAVIFVGLGISITMNYFQSIRLNRMERQLTDLVRKIAKETPHLPEKK
jgi:hypothetical protein